MRMSARYMFLMEPKRDVTILSVSAAMSRSQVRRNSEFHERVTARRGRLSLGRGVDRRIASRFAHCNVAASFCWPGRW